MPKFKCDNLSDFQTLCFKASSGWALRFCKRHTDYLNPDFSVGAKLPDHLEERASRFRVVLQQLIKEKNFSPPQIGCMDELPLNLSPSLRDKRIGPGILLKHHGLQGAQATVFLTMTANGKLLPPLLVLKVRDIVLLRETVLQKNSLFLVERVSKVFNYRIRMKIDFNEEKITDLFS